MVLNPGSSSARCGPITCAGRQVAHGDRHAEIVGKLLQFELPEADARAVAAAAVGGDQQALGVGIAFASHRTPPTTDGVSGEGRRVVVDADADPTGVAGDVVDAVRRRAPEFGNDEVVDANLFGSPLRPPFAPCTLEVADEFLLLGVDGDRWFARAQSVLHPM